MPPACMKPMCLKGGEILRSVNIPMEDLAKLLRVQMDHGSGASLTITGASMLPMLRDHRDSVELAVVTAPLKKGDLPLYRRESGQYVLHRIVGVTDKNEFICCGDNQWEPETVAEGQIMAVVKGFTRAGKSYTVSHKGYQIYVWLWVGLFPIRCPLIAMRRLLGRMRKAFRKFLC